MGNGHVFLFSILWKDFKLNANLSQLYDRRPVLTSDYCSPQKDQQCQGQCKKISVISCQFLKRKFCWNFRVTTSSAAKTTAAPPPPTTTTAAKTTTTAATATSVAKTKTTAATTTTMGTLKMRILGKSNRIYFHFYELCQNDFFTKDVMRFLWIF